MNWLCDAVNRISPSAKLWFDTGVNEQGKVVCNPTIGYGSLHLVYTKGNAKEFFQVGISTNTTGISIYIMGLNDKKILAEKFSGRIGKASVTGYCIKFKSLQEVNREVIQEVLQFALMRNSL